MSKQDPKGCSSQTDNKDKYSYFLTSKDYKVFEVEKLHFCSWLYKNGRECVEIGLQIKLKESFNQICLDDSGKIRRLPLTVWIPWVIEGDGVRSLYKEISNKENAQFIFNDACPTSTNIGDWGDVFGQVLEFKHRGVLGVMPFDIKTADGHVDLDIRVLDGYQTKDPIYVRFVLPVLDSRPTFHLKTVTNDVYAYNVNVGQLRNAPDDFPVDERCCLKDVFCIHIVPSSYCQTFSDPHAFVNLRFLEVDHYKKYVANQDCFERNITQDKYIVSFNKITSPDEKASQANAYNFFSLFTKDCIGTKQIWYSILINIGCAILLSVVSFLCSWWISSIYKNQKVMDCNPMATSCRTNANACSTVH